MPYFSGKGFTERRLEVPGAKINGCNNNFTELSCSDA